MYVIIMKDGEKGKFYLLKYDRFQIETKRKYIYLLIANTKSSGTYTLCANFDWQFNLI